MQNTELHTKKQFDLSHILVDEKLQGSQLAGFTRRAMAYILDWAIVLLCTEFFVLIIPLVFIYLFYKKKLGKTLVKNRRMLKKNLTLADHKLEKIEVGEKLRQQFKRYMTAYLYVIMYAPIVLVLMILFAFVLNLVSATEYMNLKSSFIAGFEGIVRPLSDLNDGLGLLLSFFGAFVYFSFFTWRWQGQTPAKRFLKIKIVRLNGKRITLWGSLERVMGYTASASLVGLGFLQYFWDKNCQTTHDKITETIVIEA
ncbi:RDD family protein [Porifericola rhodea]|uniref:RDD family protein n=1 Tax=Porifericola rhodea TaxID=930972 RepID=UPI00266695D7|nr:RDD family protein [Porifericola rhodea]WKN30124.1 RDD family protein [Porifericola rhodea]